MPSGWGHDSEISKYGGEGDALRVLLLLCIVLQGKSVILETKKSQMQRIRPRVVFTDRGPGLYQGSHGTTCHKYAEALAKHGSGRSLEMTLRG